MKKRIMLLILLSAFLTSCDPTIGNSTTSLSSTSTSSQSVSTSSQSSSSTTSIEKVCNLCNYEPHAEKAVYDELPSHTPTTFDASSVTKETKTLVDGVDQNTYVFNLNSGKKSQVVAIEVDLEKASIEAGSTGNKTSFSSAMSTIYSQAQAFQEDNTDKVVVAASNADFFGNGQSVNAFVKESIIIKNGHNDNGSYDYTNINSDIPASMPMLFGVSGNAAQIKPIIQSDDVKETVQSKLSYDLELTRDDKSTILTNLVSLNVYGGDKNNVNIIYKTGRDGTAPKSTIILKMKKHEQKSNRVHGEIVEISETSDSETRKIRSTNEYYYIYVPKSLGINDFQIGDVISNYVNSDDDTWKYYDTILGCRQALVIDGKIPNTVKLENTNGAQSTNIPRTSIGVMPNGNVVLFSVEALRYGGKSTSDNDPYGLNLPQLADFMRYYGVYSGANFDGGGSTQLITKTVTDAEFSVIVRSSDYGTYTLSNSRNVINTILIYVNK